MNTLSITDDEFEAMRELVRTEVGIKLSDTKRALVVARLSKRLRQHGYTTFREYYEHLATKDRRGQELLEMINCITTNKTEFFRDGRHFEYLRQRFVPEVRRLQKAGATPKLRLWSAGCSTGQEPYSIAMVIADALQLEPWDVRILASDVDTKVLAHAEKGVYSLNELAGVPKHLRLRYFKKERDGLRASDELRKMIAFRRINLIEEPWPIRTRFDAIFCCNVTIYFDQSTQERVYGQFASFLLPHGHFFAGASENLHWLSKIFAPLGGNVYQLAAAARTGS